MNHNRSRNWIENKILDRLSKRFPHLTKMQIQYIYSYPYKRTVERLKESDKPKVYKFHHLGSIKPKLSNLTACGNYAKYLINKDLPFCNECRKQVYTVKRQDLMHCHNYQIDVTTGYKGANLKQENFPNFNNND